MIWYCSDATYAGGAELYLEWLLRGSAEQAALVAFEAPGLRPYLDRLEGAGVRVERLRGSSVRERWWHFSRWLRAAKPRLLHVNMPGPYDGMLATAPVLAKRFAHCAVVVTEHLPSVPASGKRALWKRIWAPRVDRAIALCKPHSILLERVHGYRPERIRIVPNGVPDPGPADTAPQGGGRFRMLQIGALDPRKGGAELIEIVAACVNDGLDLDLCFLGDGPMRGAWSARAEELGVAQRIRFAGHQDDVAPYLRASDVVVLHSRREGMPLSLLEAMASAKAIVATPVDGIPEMLAGAGGRMAAFGDLKAWRATIAELVARPDLRHAMGVANRNRYLAQHQLQQMLDRTHDVYAELLR